MKVLKKADKHKIVALERVGEAVEALVLSCSSKNIYHVTLNLEDLNWTCTCEAGFNYNLCSHIIKVALEIKALSNIIEGKGGASMGMVEVVKLENPVIDMIGGLPVRTPLAIFGYAGTGKSIFAYEVAFEYAKKTKRNVLVIDTEGNEHTYHQWLSVFSQKYNLKAKLIPIPSQLVKKKHVNSSKYEVSYEIATEVVNSNYPTIYLVECFSAEELLALVGRPVNVLISKEGKIRVVPETGWTWRIFDTPIASILEKGNIGLVIIDSLSAPLEEFGSDRANLPARADVIKFFKAQFEKLLKAFNLSAICVLHEMRDVTNPYDTADFTGGKVLHHVFKFVVRLKLVKDNRVFEIFRHPSLPPKSKSVVLKLTEKGYVW